ncbi:MAG TPA: hypothetical protein VJH37_00060 [Candidatus Nanoarchaeia archaeon]|nr:hypothetical protein [Candidatus Nanoarchaeia archaeon]
MTSNKGLAVNALVLILIGLVVIFSIVFIIMGYIPRSFQDFQNIEKEITAQLASLKNGAALQTSEDTAFLKIYSAFTQAFTVCMRSPTSSCWCELPLVKNYPQNYHIFMAHDAKNGYYSYTYVTKDEKKILLQHDVLLPEQNSAKGYFFRTNELTSYSSPRLDISLDPDGILQIITPSETIPSSLQHIKNLFSYNLNYDVLLLHKTDQQQPEFISPYAYNPTLNTYISQTSLFLKLPQCAVSPSTTTPP